MPNWQLKLIQPEELQSVWPAVRRYLENVQHYDTWIPEDVYHAIKSRQAVLYTVDGGCLIVKSLRDQYSNEPYLHVWIAYSDNVGAIENCLSQVDAIAKSLGITRITCNSTRPGFERAGFKRKMMSYERLL